MWEFRDRNEDIGSISACVGKTNKALEDRNWKFSTSKVKLALVIMKFARKITRLKVYMNLIIILCCFKIGK